jgi:hypothetical protein
MGITVKKVVALFLLCVFGSFQNICSRVAMVHNCNFAFGKGWVGVRMKDNLQGFKLKLCRGHGWGKLTGRQNSV